MTNLAGKSSIFRTLLEHCCCNSDLNPESRRGESLGCRRPCSWLFWILPETSNHLTQVCLERFVVATSTMKANVQ